MEMKLVITPSIPLTTNRQQHRNNIPSTNPEQYYRREITIPLLDRLTQEMKFRSTKLSNQISTLPCLIPSVICSPDMNLDFHNIVSEYKDEILKSQIKNSAYVSDTG